ncbi:MAG: MATE family efflux transporter [Coriobacteriales bacterium]|jgi:putative MATE family efflux protein|nr:MATE family efflux transporter [Coriobacteriales bacterium]
MTVRRLGTENIGRLMLEFVIPSIISISMTSVYNLIDAIFLGQMVGEVGIAATQAAYPLSMAIMTIFSLPGIGGIILVSLALGAGKAEEADRVLGNTVTLTLIICGACTVAGLALLEPVLLASGASAEIMPDAKRFAGITIGGTIFAGLFLNLNNFIRSAGNPRRALLYNGGGMALCIIFNFLFVVLLRWGVIGSALATLLGQGISAVAIISYFRSEASVLRLHRRGLVLARHIAGRTMVLGIPMSFAQFVYCLVAFVMNFVFVSQGVHMGLDSGSTLAVVGVISRVSMFSSFALFGVSIAAQPIMGYNYGAGQSTRLRQSFWVAVAWAVSTGVLCLCVVLLFSRQIVGAFGLPVELSGLTERLLRITMLFIPLTGFAVIVMEYYQATAKAVLSTVLAAFKQGLLLVPLFFIMPVLLPLLIPSVSALDSLIWAVPISDGIAFVVSVLLIAREFKRLKRIGALSLEAAARDIDAVERDGGCHHAA